MPNPQLMYNDSNDLSEPLLSDDYWNTNSPTNNNNVIQHNTNYNGLGRRQLYALIKKNILLRLRNPFMTLVELLSPLLIIALISIGYSYSLLHISHTDTNVFTKPEQIVNAITTFQSGLIPNIPDWKPTRESTHCTVLPMAPNWMFCYDTETDLNMLYAVTSYNGPTPIPTLKQYVEISHAFSSQFGNQSDPEVLQKMNQLNLLVDGQFTNLLFLGELWFITNNNQCTVKPCIDNGVPQFIQFMLDTADGMHDVTVRLFDNEQIALDTFDTLNTTTYVWAVINIHTFDTENHIDYSIRMNHTVIPSTYSIHDRFNIGLDTSFKEYLFSGFATLQYTFDTALLNYTGSMIDPINIHDSIHGSHLDITSPNNITISPFPIPSYQWNRFYQTMGPFMGLLLSMCYMIPVSLFVKTLVDDKESRMKEVMRVMSMIDWTYTLSYHIVTSIIFVLSAVLFSVAVHNTFFSHIDITVLLVFMVIHVLTLINFCFMLSTWFNKGKMASILTPIILILFTLPRYAYYNGSDSSVSGHTVGMTILSLLFSPTGFTFGCDMFIRYEAASITLNWSNIFTDEYSMGRVLIILSCNFIIYGVLAWYFENVVPNEYGSHQAPWFMLTRTYWFEPTIDTEIYNIVNAAESPATRQRRDTLNESNNFNIEHVSDTMLDKARLKIRKLRKVFTSGYGKYKTTNVAVQGLDLTLYNGQITSLLGQNGAGKTTTISMLTGLMSTTSGCFTLGDYNNVQHMRFMRRNIGICAQTNTLYPELTVYEQLELFATLKNVPSNEIHSTVTQIIAEVGLSSKTNALTATLSGGQQRKVCVACAFVGGSNIVFLDEPTTGMDPLSRRSTWDILKAYKRNRVILLTTHFLDEADLLSDRIAVMCNGRLQCVGSSLFLKSRYGIGYNLTMVKSSRKCDIERVHELVYRHVSDAELLSTSAAEISYQLPLSAVSLFADLFTELEETRHKLFISAYGVSMTSLEEVFLRIIDDQDTTNNNNGLTSAVLSPATNSPVVGRSRTISNVSNASTSSVPPTPLKKRLQQQLLGDELFHYNHNDTKQQYNTYISQFCTLMYKRYIVAVRDPVARMVEIIVPLVTVIIVLLIFNLSRKGVGYKLNLGTSLYKNVGIHTEETPVLIVNNNVQYIEPDTITYMSTNTDYTLQYTDYTSCVNVSDYLLSTAFVNNDNRYGAIVFNDSFTLDFKHSPVPFGPRVKEYILNFPVNIMHNSSFYHSVPVLLNEIATARYNGLHNTQHIQYNTYSHPLPAATRPTIKQQTFLSLLTAAFILIPFCYIPASYVTFIVNERIHNIKHMQLLSGVNSTLYWLTIYIFDIFNYIIVSTLVMIVLLVFDNNLYVKSWTNISATYTVLTLYGTSVIPLSYCYSTLFHSTTSAQIGIMSLHFVFGFILTIVSFMFDLIESLHAINVSIKIIYRMFPAYNLGEALINISINELKNSYTGSNVSVWSTDVIGKSLICMGIQSAVYMLIPFILETQITRKLLTYTIDFVLKCIRKQPAEHYEYDDSTIDDDVLNEQLLIQRHTLNSTDKQQLSSLLIHTPAGSDDIFECKMSETDMLKLPPTSPLLQIQRSLSVEPDNLVEINQLRKVYNTRNNKPIVAVHSLSLGIRRGECFGLLGINGAGKTTTMKMLTGDILPTSGDATVNHHSIVSDINGVRNEIGYCPQFDPLIDCMTAREQLYMYAKFKGTIKPTFIKTYVDSMLHRLKLDKFANSYSGTYSGGNKRKLSLAIALIGNPSVVMLDEPSSGMDPVSRRFMWSVISSLSDTNKSSILTSHSMSETEALCQRIGIMINGKLRCIGSIQHLKAKFGRGYNIELNAEERYIPAIQQFVSTNFEQVELVEHNTTRLTFALNKTNTSLAKIFSLIEQNKYELHIDDYSVSQSTLEQVFLSQATKSV